MAATSWGRGLRGEGDRGQATGGNADSDGALGIDVGEGAAEVEGDAKILGGVLGGCLVVGGGAVSGVTAILFAAGVSIAAAHDDEGNPSAAGEPLGLGEKRPGGDFGMLLRLARRAMGDDDQRLFAGHVGVDEQGIKAGGCGLRPGDEELALDVVRRGGGLSRQGQDHEKKRQAAPASHR